MKKNSNKKRAFIWLGSFLLIGLLFFVSPVEAGGEWWAENVIGGIIRVLISAIGLVMVLVIKALVWVAQYNDFISSPPVEYSWTIVRDIANMFFVVVLLIISFATILNQEKYSYKTWLPKVILMAVLINFSKTICGLMIDVTQVVMLTFVNAFKGMAAGNLISNLGIIDVVTLANNRQDIGFWEIVGAYFLGLIYMIVALVVIVTMVAMLVMRMVMIWIYVALSPMAYLLSAFPGGQRYSSMWWSDFSKNLIVGPILAFFIWLSFASMAAFNPSDYQTVEKTTTSGLAGEILIEGTQQRGGESSTVNDGVTNAGKLDVFIKFIISIGMLVGGLKIASEIGGAAGSIAGKGMAKLQQGAAWTGKKIGDFGKERIKGVGKFAVRNAIGLGGAALSKVGNAVGDNKAGRFLKEMGATATTWKADLLSTKKKNKEKKRLDFMEKLGMKEDTLSKVDSLMQNDTTKNVSNVSVGAIAGANVGAIVGGPVGMALGGAIGAIIGKAPDWLSRGVRKEMDGKSQLASEEGIKANDNYLKANERKKGIEDLSAQKSEHETRADENRKTSKEKLSEADSLEREVIHLKEQEFKANSEGRVSDANDINARIGQKNLKISNLKNESTTLLADAANEDSMANNLTSQIQNLSNEEKAFRSQGDYHKQQEKNNLNDVDNLKNKKSFKFWQNAQAFTTVTTQKAAAAGSKDIKNARDKVSVLEKDKDAMKGPDGFGKEDFYSKSGQTDIQKKLFSQLAVKDSHSSSRAIQNMAAWAANIDINNKKEMDKAEAVASGIAAFAKGGGDISSFGELISQLDVKNRQNPKNPVDSVKKLKEKVIANRKTGLVTEQGSGALHVNTFANNDSNENGKNIIGVDFNKLSGTGLDIKADASFVSGESVAPIIEALKKQIENERNLLNEAARTDSISDDDFIRKQNDLDKAEARLSDPKQVQDLQLINTGSSNYSRKERMISKYHEEIHTGGIEDEDLTERTAQSLINNKLYGRNAKTGGRHATEIASFIKEKQNQGLDNDEIMAEVEVEIKRRLNQEGQNRAARVIAMEKGEKESEPAYLEEDSSDNKKFIETNKDVNLDASSFEEALSLFTEKINTILKNIPNTTATAKQGGGSLSADRNILYALNLIAKNIQGNSNILKKIQNLSGGSAPKTVLELTALNAAISESDADKKTFNNVL